MLFPTGYTMKKIKIRLSGIHYYDSKGRCYRKLVLKGFKLVKVRISKFDHSKV